jgi:hypothetical protein
VGKFIDAGSQTKTETSFTTHGMLPQCDRVIDWMPGDKKDFLGLDGTDSPFAPAGATRVPGFVQWKIDVPVGADSINAHLVLNKNAGSFSGSGSLLGGGGAMPKLELIVGPPGEAIAWVPKTSGGNEVASAMFSGTSGAINATLSGLPPGPSYVMIVNGGGGIIAENITFDTSCSTPDGCQPDMAMARPSEGGGCKCSFGGDASPAPLMFFLILAIAGVRRFAALR